MPVSPFTAVWVKDRIAAQPDVLDSGESSLLILAMDRAATTSAGNTLRTWSRDADDSEPPIIRGVCGHVLPNNNELKASLMKVATGEVATVFADGVRPPV